MRGQLKVSLITLLEMIIVFAIIGAATLIAFRIYPIFFGTTDAQAENAYDLMADTIDSMLRSDTAEIERRSIFPYKKINDFTGTIFAIDSRGVISEVFPPLSEQIDENSISSGFIKKLNGTHLSDELCNSDPCLCFTRELKSVTEKSIKRAFEDPERCTTFKSDYPVVFTVQLTGGDLDLETRYETVIVKEPFQDGSRISLQLDNPS
ncbi:type II secretion system protein [Candidatus Woesearchaeota archaeon]|nr:type II secretion system protein [Candidatus Woesearchaeota archaeon]